MSTPRRLQKIAARADALDDARNALYWAVQDARADAHTWQEIADTLGVTKQAAQQRFPAAIIDPEQGPRSVEPLSDRT